MSTTALQMNTTSTAATTNALHIKTVILTLLMIVEMTLNALKTKITFTVAMVDAQKIPVMSKLNKITKSQTAQRMRTYASIRIETSFIAAKESAFLITVTQLRDALLRLNVQRTKTISTAAMVTAQEDHATLAQAPWIVALNLMQCAAMMMDTVSIKNYVNLWLMRDHSAFIIETVEKKGSIHAVMVFV